MSNQHDDHSPSRERQSQHYKDRHAAMQRKSQLNQRYLIETDTRGQIHMIKWPPYAQSGSKTASHQNHSSPQRGNNAAEEKKDEIGDGQNSPNGPNGNNNNHNSTSQFNTLHDRSRGRIMSTLPVQGKKYDQQRRSDGEHDEKCQ